MEIFHDYISTACFAVLPFHWGEYGHKHDRYKITLKTIKPLQFIPKVVATLRQTNDCLISHFLLISFSLPL